MERYIISAIVLYALFIALYLLREQIIKRKKNAAKNSVFNPFKSAPKEDIVGKSQFDLRQSRTEATTLIQNEKRADNSNTFADESKKDAPVAPPLVETETVLSDNNMTEENSNEINLTIENTPPEFEPEYNDEDVDEEETEDEDTEGVAGVSIALGLDFNDLAGMVRTVAADSATSEKKEEAGRVLVEIRKTEMFEQVADDEPKKKVVSSLMDDYFAAFHRKKREAGETNEPSVKAPKEFDVRNFA